MFFAENVMVLQEMHIDDGGQEMLERVNPSSVRRQCVGRFLMLHLPPNEVHTLKLPSRSSLNIFF